jgi:hypothetical protein
MADSNDTSSYTTDKDDFRMYYEMQYKRMGELENQRLTMSNLIITVSVLSFGLAFEDTSKINIVNGLALPSAVILINLIAVAHGNRSREFIKMHQKRAKVALTRYAPELAKISLEEVEKRDSNQDALRRPLLQVYIHLVLVVMALFAVGLYITTL